jgi:3-phenylpropionate/cinnamic acid dioxygenase small subunit
MSTAAGSRVRGERYADLCDLLWHEAELLSAPDYAAWRELLAPDIRYRVTTPYFHPPGKPRDYGLGAPYFDEDRDSLGIRIEQQTRPGFTRAENPRSVLRLVVSNIRAFAGEMPGTYAVRSHVLLFRVRFTDPQPFIITAARDDVWRERPEDGFELVLRNVRLDEVTLQTPNLSFFL